MVTLEPVSLLSTQIWTPTVPLVVSMCTLRVYLVIDTCIVCVECRAIAVALQAPSLEPRPVRHISTDGSEHTPYTSQLDSLTKALRADTKGIQLAGLYTGPFSVPRGRSNRQQQTLTYSTTNTYLSSVISRRTSRACKTRGYYKLYSTTLRKFSRVRY